MMEPLTVRQWRAVPLTLALIALSVLGFLLVYLHAPLSWVSALTFSDFESDGRNIRFVAHQGQYWRLLTPVFLHFSWLHIAFNSLWLWELGGKLELRLGSGMLVLLVIVIGIGSNAAQFLYSGPSLFGGMSGVVYGLLGYCWVLGALEPRLGLVLPQGIIWFMLLWLMFGLVMPTQMLGFGSIANGAHLGGLLLGCVAGLVSSAVRRFSP
ncbi:MAG: rhomboid family intramembrane serine protease [Gammaproteobacteria bacterium]|nr:rhomboid family intramembrane serine protease [Gammaproteobacteria bacterium]